MNDYFEKVINYLAEVELCRIKSVIPPTFSLFDILQYPEKLYKFRSGKKHDYDALINDYIWLDTPIKFADKEDARVNLGQDDNIDIAQNNQAELKVAIAGYAWESARQMFEKCHISKNTFITMATDQSFEEMTLEKMEKRLVLYVSHLPERDRPKMEKLLSEKLISFRKLVNDVEEQREIIIGAFQNDTKVCCLTESYDNRMMWENYAGGYSGFAVEYSIPKAVKITTAETETILSILPVSYYENPPHADVSQIFVELANNNGKMILQDGTKKAFADLYRQIITKKIYYQEEREWRLIRGKEEKQRFSFPYITAVYAGYKIKPHNLARLKNICATKDIKLFVQEFDSIERKICYRKL